MRPANVAVVRRRKSTESGAEKSFPVVRAKLVSLPEPGSRAAWLMLQQKVATDRGEPLVLLSAIMTGVCAKKDFQTIYWKTTRPGCRLKNVAGLKSDKPLRSFVILLIIRRLSQNVPVEIYLVT